MARKKNVYISKKLDVIDKEIEALKEQLAEVKEKRRQIISNTKIRCVSNAHGEGCDRLSKIKSVTVIHEQQYIPPYGCTGGDYYIDSKLNWICPHCQHQNRLIHFYTDGKDNENFFNRNKQCFKDQRKKN